MALTVGARVGPYEVVGSIGAGGMGEVYRARDTKLGRDVALKILPAAFSDDADRVARFRREAQVLASLNHPNIAAIYGLEDIPSGGSALVLELVEGPTLAERITRSVVPIAEAMAIAAQIADALETAHERGIVHRDLKPSNVKLTPDGRVKVLDFGLAKLAGDGAPADVSHSPTITVAHTAPSVLLGTAAYMSPEQARGQVVDKRADIWAFGCVLYEMLTGRSAFAAPTLTDTLAAIVEREPDWQRLPAALPANVGRLLRRCLVKDPRQRLRDVGDARLELNDLASRTAGASPTSQSTRRRASIAIAVASLLSVGLFTGVNLWRGASPRPASRQVMQLALALPETPLTNVSLNAFPQSPDGAQLAYVAAGPPARLVIQSLETGQARVLPGTEGARNPFFSPDGRWLGFFADRKLKKVALAGGSPQDLADAPNPRGGAWASENVIVFSPLNNSPLFEVPADGGPTRRLTSLDANAAEFSHRWPCILPTGDIVFAVTDSAASWDDARIVVFGRKTNSRHVLVEGGTFPRYTASGHLVYSRHGSLLAVPLDLMTLRPTSSPVPVLDDVRQNVTSGAAGFGISGQGALVYMTGGMIGAGRRLVWVDRHGRETPLTAPVGAYERLSLSPDSQRVAVAISGRNQDIWVYDVGRQSQSRLTFEGSQNYPIWTPDGQRVVFDSARRGIERVLWRSLDGSGPEEPLVATSGVRVPDSWSRDGETLVFSEQHQESGWDLFMLRVNGDRSPAPILQTRFDEDAGMISPDGRWLAYVSNETGRSEVYVRAFPRGGARWPISSEGGREPVWSRDGRELFYRAGTRMMRAAITAGPTFSASRAEVLFDGPYQTRPASAHANYDVSGDGRFLMVKDDNGDAVSARTNLVLNWTDELTRRVPVK